jgi:hypothetical protein
VNKAMRSGDGGLVSTLSKISRVYPTMEAVNIGVQKMMVLSVDDPFLVWLIEEGKLYPTLPRGWVLGTQLMEKYYNGKWYAQDSLYIYVGPGIDAGSNMVAGFSMKALDGKGVVEGLRNVLRKGYVVVIMTNQIASSVREKESRYNTRVTMIKNLNLPPIIILMALEQDGYAKPNTGMWEVLKGLVPNADPSQSSYCGTNNIDQQFAANTGVTYYPANMLFGE